MKANWLPIVIVIIISIVIINDSITWYQQKQIAAKLTAAYIATEPVDTVWRGWNKYQIKTSTDSGKLIWYGHELIANTAYYLGPKGIVAHTTNGMNCQNCHLDGGTIPYGNNFGKVYATYPQFRARNNGIQSIYGRVNDCFERSLNGKALDSSTHEMQAIYAYMQWLGDGVPKGVARGGTSIMKLKYLDVAADPIAGKKVYVTNCQSCHGNNGQGQLNIDGNAYTYPPMWGEHSYNDGAGLYRLSSFAGFAKNNMPFGSDYHNTKLTDKEAWDVAAFVNSQPRPHKNQSADWKNIANKPIDFPFGPYTDTFTETQHKYGPFTPIKNSKSTKK
ncbi:MAG: c-type cytochrome [Pedobacter sp.]|nr:c-type cytochrome [Chitinophagaceae bacterium]